MKNFSIIKNMLPLLVAIAVVGGIFGAAPLTVTSSTAQAAGLDLAIPELAVIPVTSTTYTLRTCDVTASAYQVTAGTNVTISWTTQGFTNFTLNGVTVSGPNGSETFENIQANTTYLLTARTADGKNDCTASVTVLCIPVPPPTCTLTPTAQTITAGGSVTLAWSTTNAASASLTDFGTVALSGSQTTGALTANRTYTLTVVGTNGTTVTCPSVVTVTQLPVPTCDTFTATPQTITRGNSATLAWSTTNASRVVINSGIGEVAASGTLSVAPLTTTEYLMTVFGASATETSCRATVTVTEPLVPACTSFTATPASLPVGGGSVVLAWTSVNATSATISPTVGSVAVTGSTTLTLATSTTFTLTVLGANNQTNTCTVAVPVQPPVPVPFTCENNVSFTASPTRITRGNESTLTWNTTGATAVSFNQGITDSGFSGTRMVEPRDTTTYVLTATNGTDTVSCPVTVTVTSGGGGGGPSSPICEISVSKNSITAGDTVTLRYDSSRASDLKLVDSNGKTLVTTRGKLSSEKDDLMEGSLKVSPKSDTTYTLTVERGSKDRVCKVKVDVKDTVVVTQVRDQLPLVISLTDVPYTGFEAGPLLTMSFYLLLMAWALYIAYIIVIKRDIIGGYRLAGSRPDGSSKAVTPEAIRPDVFVASVRAPEVPPSVSTPPNLPTGTPVIGYAAASGVATTVPGQVSPVTDETVTTLENYAHAKKALLSSDAIRHLIGTTSSDEERIASLNEVITEAKATYPSEDGWVVINEKRMRELCLVCQAKPEPSSAAPFVPAIIPEGSGSLAEAIVTGNIVAAYEMIGHRPMFALADAAADMDSVLRARRGGTEVISDMLLASTKSLSEEQIMNIITALTGALDGTYTDEASAVKMAIMKAVKVVA